MDLEGGKRKLFTILGKISLKKMKKDQLLILALAGILLLVIALPTEKKGTEKKKTETGLGLSDGSAKASQDEYLCSLESRLEAALSQMEGVGDVTVMITLKSSAEKVVEKDMEVTDETVTESDSQGGARSSKNGGRKEATVYGDGGSAGEPYVSKELSPRIEGVVVIAEGGSDSVVKQNITEAVQALFGIDTHKIRVIKKS